MVHDLKENEMAMEDCCDTVVDTDFDVNNCNKNIHGSEENEENEVTMEDCCDTVLDTDFDVKAVVRIVI